MQRDVYAETLLDGKTIVLAQPVAGLMLSASAVPSSNEDGAGLYVSRLKTEDYVAIRQMMKVK